MPFRGEQLMTNFKLVETLVPGEGVWLTAHESQALEHVLWWLFQAIRFLIHAHIQHTTLWSFQELQNLATSLTDWHAWDHLESCMLGPSSSLERPHASEFLKKHSCLHIHISNHLHMHMRHMDSFHSPRFRCKYPHSDHILDLQASYIVIIATFLLTLLNVSSFSTPLLVYYTTSFVFVNKVKPVMLSYALFCLALLHNWAAPQPLVRAFATSSLPPVPILVNSSCFSSTDLYGYEHPVFNESVIGEISITLTKNNFWQLLNQSISNKTYLPIEELLYENEVVKVVHFRLKFM